MITRRAVTVLYRGGPRDGATEPHTPTGSDMPPELNGYRRGGVGHDGHHELWRYTWPAEHTGLRQPCRAGDQDGCPGARCPAGRTRQTT